MSKRSDAIAAALRKAIEQGEYGDGERLSQSRLSLQHGAHRDVISHALYRLQFEGFVSQDAEHRYHANASYTTRQLQRVLTQLEHIESLCSRTVIQLTGDTRNLMLPGRTAMIAKLNPRPGRRAQPRSTAQQGSAS